MPCYQPLRGWKQHASKWSPGQKRRIVFNAKEADLDLPVEIPCGQCIGCKLERSRQWAIRCVHEASLHDANSFITLTYAPEFLPPLGSLVLEHWQLFMKRFRERVAPQKLRFFMCGEYGERNSRPHYHGLIFGWDFPEKLPLKVEHEQQYWVDPMLAEIWTYGNHVIGEMTFESAAYVARYCTKKITGDAAKEHYMVVDQVGEILGDRKPEFVTMSRRPGIGAGWLAKFGKDTYNDDSIIMRGKQMKPPKFYDRVFEKEDFASVHRWKVRRKTLGRRAMARGLGDRLLVREEIQMLRFKRLKRGYEGEG